MNSCTCRVLLFKINNIPAIWEKKMELKEWGKDRREKGKWEKRDIWENESIFIFWKRENERVLNYQRVLNEEYLKFEIVNLAPLYLKFEIETLPPLIFQNSLSTFLCHVSHNEATHLSSKAAANWHIYTLPDVALWMSVHYFLIL